MSSRFLFAMRSGSVSGGTRRDISFERLLELAKSHSEEVYNRYKGVNADNWIDYVIDKI